MLVLVGAVLLLSGCVDTTAAPSPVTADPHDVAALAVKISASSGDFAPYSGCLAFEAVKRMTPEVLAVFEATGSLEDADGHLWETAKSMFAACLTTNELATMLVRSAFENDSGLTFNESETRCAVGKVTADAKYRSTRAILDAFDSSSDVAAKEIVNHLAGCIGRGSLAATIQRTGGGKLSLGMSQCVTDQLITRYGSPGNVMQKIIAEDPSVDAASVAAARACLAAGQR